ncbi:orotate phosphoribosyltransferase [Cerasibacillus quisquiliarum]|uniref:Orotate phosphoribosyltransferase n=2 Tax=Cerasibacillus quisquiliarum TaxID=227865 RepID=A0A511UUU0_9BACI|nr:orotate phosphoribosyltransferase [Cerasibacillus quisquiliarum]GEN30369.1 orotate phosphoribosyltransferase [Cerasibacillus quisquiliarum]
MDMNQEIAKQLLAIKAVQIKPNPNDFFTWTSGLKSPIYCDNRLTMSYPNVRKNITNAFISMIDQLDEKPDVIAGCATAGIPHAAWLANELELPMIYIRSSAKKHGKGNKIEGKIEKGKKVIIIEDLISTGGSSVHAALAAKEAGFDVIGVLAIFTYGLEQAKINFAEKKITYKTITSFEDLIELLKNRGKVEENEVKSLMDWRDSLQ